MAHALTKSHPRLWSLENGTVMVVTDLHGNWDVYRRYRDRFLQLKSAGRVDWLVFTGDLIHAEHPKGDHSLEIVLDVLALKKSYGSAIIYLCGNHELPHIYGISLSKGERLYTPDFERAMYTAHRRTEVLGLFDSLPFYLRTRAGISLTHAGAPAIDAANIPQLFNWDHQDLLYQADEAMATESLSALRAGYERHHGNLPYAMLAEHYLAVTDPEDPRYNDLLRGFVATSHPLFDRLLWPALFTRNEEEYGLRDYRIFLDSLLQALSAGYVPQRVLVTGHIKVKHGGYQIIARDQLRLASGPHARPPTAGLYLRFDAAQPAHNTESLLSGLESVFK